MEPKGLARKGASRLPRGDQGLTGATSTRRCSLGWLDSAHRSAQAAATMMATPPPWEVPSRLKSLRPSASANCRTRSAVARTLQSMPSFAVENPAPKLSKAYTVAWDASAGMVNLQEKE